MNLSVIGTGYVGLVTGACLASMGHRVICVDNAGARVEKISRGEAPFFEPGLDRIVAKSISSGRLTATTDLGAAIAATEVSLIAVGTPDQAGHADLSQVESAAAEVGAALRAKRSYHVVAVKSTVVPGTTDGIVLSALERTAGKPVGPEIGLCMNPEFLREGTAVDDFMAPDRIVIGAFDHRAAETLGRLYERFDCPKPVVSLRNAEFTKYASNALLATLISFSNELAALCEATPGADVEIVLDCLHLDKRLSPLIEGRRALPGILSYLRPGSGYGGSCLPKDLSALRALGRDLRVDTALLDAVAAINEKRTAAVLDLAELRSGKLAGRKVAVLGLAFKPGTDDLRHSPAIELVVEILRRGAKVTVCDPFATGPAKGILGDSVDYARDALEAVTGVDIAVIGTGWPQWHELDWTKVKQAMRGNVVFDARNSLRSLPLPEGLVRIQVGAGN